MATIIKVVIDYQDDITVTKSIAAPLADIKGALHSRQLRYTEDIVSSSADNSDTDRDRTTTATTIYVKIPLVSHSRYDLEEQLDFLNATYAR